MSQPKSNRKRLADALRSGKYKKGRMNLKKIFEDGSESYCPMGVACELYREEWPNACEWIDDVTFHSDNGKSYKMSSFKLPYINLRNNSTVVMSFPPRPICEYYGLTTGNVDDIIGMNDKTSSNNFSEIADYIEYEMEGLNG